VFVAALLVSVTAAVRVSGRWSGQTPPQTPPADLVLRNGRIVTLDDRVPEGQALASRAGKIVAVGTNADVARYIGPSTQVIDLAGQFAMPGFIEGHGHFTGIGESKLGLEAGTRTSGHRSRSRMSMATRRTHRSTPCRRTIPSC
jgi:predicted amidohydrolase YtcJ